MTRQLLALALLACTASAQPLTGPLVLEDVLASVEASHPLLLAAIQEQAIARGKVLGAEGAFDTKLSIESDTNQFGYYKNRAGWAKIEQPIAGLGGELFGGYKRGQGNFGPWEQNFLTLSGGEWGSGVRLPLLRNREIDERRTDLLLAQLSIELADASVEGQRLKLFETASKLYWDWVFRGHKLGVAEELLRLAEARSQQVDEAVAAGEIAAIEIADNQRAVLERRTAVISAERELQNAGYELSLFYRDSEGRPQVVTRARLPEFPEPGPVSAEQMKTDLMRALDHHPAITGMLVEQRQNYAELALARNQMLPEIDFAVQYSRDTGTGSITKRGPELIAGITLTSPFQRRKAKGAVASQEAKLEQLDQKIRFTRNRIEVEVRDAVSALDAALRRLQLARSELNVAQELAEAERERFDLGGSTLFVVNLRELSTAAARLKVASALADCHNAIAIYRAAAAMM